MLNQSSEQNNISPDATSPSIIIPSVDSVDHTPSIVNPAPPEKHAPPEILREYYDGMCYMQPILISNGRYLSLYTEEGKVKAEILSNRILQLEKDFPTITQDYSNLYEKIKRTEEEAKKIKEKEKQEERVRQIQKENEDCETRRKQQEQYKLDMIQHKDKFELYDRLRRQVHYMARKKTDVPLTYENAKVIIDQMNELVQSHPFLLRWESTLAHPFLHECLGQMADLDQLCKIEWYKTYAYAYECLYDVFKNIKDQYQYTPLGRWNQIDLRAERYQTDDDFRQVMNTKVDLSRNGMDPSGQSGQSGQSGRESTQKIITIQEWLASIVHQYHLFVYPAAYLDRIYILPYQSEEASKRSLTNDRFHPAREWICGNIPAKEDEKEEEDKKKE